MKKYLNIILFSLILFFLFSVYEYYSSNKNIKYKKNNRVNIDQIFKDKILDLPVLVSDTHDVIEFNNSFENETKNEKKKEFLEFIKK